VERARVVVEIYAGDAVDAPCGGDVCALSTNGKADEILMNNKLGMIL